MLCCDYDEAKERHPELERILLPTGMKLKHPVNKAICHLTEDSQAEWLGFIIRRRCHELSFEIAESSFYDLAEKLRQCHQYPWSAGRASQVIRGRLQSLGPAFEKQDAIDTCIMRLQPMLKETAFDEVFSPEKLKGICCKAWCSWNRLRLLSKTPTA